MTASRFCPMDPSLSTCRKRISTPGKAGRSTVPVRNLRAFLARRAKRPWRPPHRRTLWQESLRFFFRHDRRHDSFRVRPRADQDAALFLRKRADEARNRKQSAPLFPRAKHRLDAGVRLESRRQRILRQENRRIPSHARETQALWFPQGRVLDRVEEEVLDVFFLPHSLKA